MRLDPIYLKLPLNDICYIRAHFSIQMRVLQLFLAVLHAPCITAALLFSVISFAVRDGKNGNR